MLQSPGKFFIFAGILLIIVGLLISWKCQIPWLGRLPGDIFIKKDNFSLYFPITTCLVLSVLLTVVFYLLKK